MDNERQARNFTKITMGVICQQFSRNQRLTTFFWFQKLCYCLQFCICGAISAAGAKKCDF